MSLTGFHPLWNKILSQNLQAVADQGCHLEGSSTYKGTAYRRVYCRSMSLRMTSEFAFMSGMLHVVWQQ
jgi:hypothetical protein